MLGWSVVRMQQNHVSSDKTHLITQSPLFLYCKFGNFRENYIFANSVKGQICDIKKWQLGYDLP